MSRIGPRTYHEPPRTILSCNGCRYFDDQLLCHRMVGESDYESLCRHPEAEIMGGFPRSIGRHHGMGWPTPSWCPVITAPQHTTSQSGESK